MLGCNGPSSKRNASVLQEVKRLYCFDLDDTLFHTEGKAIVRANNQIVRYVSNEDLKTDKLIKGESYDWSQYDSSSVFARSRPIEPMIKKLIKIHNKSKKSPGDKILINTARRCVTDNNEFLAKFKQYGIDINNITIAFANSIDTQNTDPEKKAFIIERYILNQWFNHIEMYDDNKANLDGFLDLKNDYSKVKFVAYHVMDGKIKRYKG
jgi:hypothetical protein